MAPGLNSGALVAETRITLDDIAANPALAISLSPREVADLLARAGGVESVLHARLVAEVNSPPAKSSTPDKANDQMLTLREAAARIRKSVRWVRDNWHSELPFGKRVGRSILFSAAGLDRWLRRS